jgi:L-2-hydroxyglutarate oxidase LhgO
VTAGGFVLDVGGAEPMTLACRLLVNCAGHGAPPLARRIAGIPPDSIPGNFFKRGVYFTVTGAPPFRRLIYPVHGKTGMDIHAVIDLAGNVRFGPDVEWIDRLDYTVDPGRAEKFYPSIRSFWPGLAMARCSRAMRAFGRASAGRAPRLSTSRSADLPCMACPDSSTCSASSRPA